MPPDDLSALEAELARWTALDDEYYGGIRHHVERLDANLKTTIAREWDLVLANDALVIERDALKAERDALKAERDALKAERDALVIERDALKAERDALVSAGCAAPST